MRKCKVQFGKAAIAVAVGVAAYLPALAEKLPVKSMPDKGLLASFDYDDGKETNRGYGKVTRDNESVTFEGGVASYNGIYGSRPPGNEDHVIPGLNFDRFTVACSFNPAHTNAWGQYFFRIGMSCWSILEVQLGKKDVTVYGRKLKTMAAPFVKNDWNWLVISVDYGKRQALLSVNGCDPVVQALPDDFFWFIPSDRMEGDKFRRITFGNWQCGRRYWGRVDDLKVYDRALDQDEISRICRGEAAEKGRAVASVENPKPPEIPKLGNDRWTFVPGTEQSVYWNGWISTKGMALRARRNQEGICVESVGKAPASELDLSLPVVDGEGKPLAIVGIGSECDPYCMSADASSLTAVKLPKTLKTIRKNAFAGCRNLTHVELPESVESIGPFSFCKCDMLAELTIPESVTRIEELAFRDCKALRKLEIRGQRVWIGQNVFREASVGSEVPQKEWTSGPLVLKPSASSATTASAPSDWKKGPNANWFVRWEDAQAAARKSGKKIFVLKTGSDWCPWCVRLHDNVLAKKEFLDFAEKNLVLLYLDSPKKAGQPEEQKKHNAEVSRRLRLGGGYPNASVVDVTERNLGSVSGGGYTVEKYIEKLNEILKSGAGDAPVAARPSVAERTPVARSAATANIHSRVLRHAKASEVKKALDELTADGNAVKGTFRVTANDRLNKLVIITDESNMAFVDAVIRQLDVSAGGGSAR